MRFRFRQVTANEAWSRVALIVETQRPDAAAGEPRDLSAGNSRHRDVMSSVPGDRPGDPALIHDPGAKGLHGPHCPYSRTLKTTYPWRIVRRQTAGGSEVVTHLSEIPETCLWEPVHPFLYDAVWWDGEENRIEARVGVRSLSMGPNGCLLNGLPFRIRGVSLGSVDASRIERFRESGINLVVPSSPLDDQALDRIDGFGPFAAGWLPPDIETAMDQVASAGPTRPGIGLWIANGGWSDDTMKKLRTQDPATLFATTASKTEVASGSPASFAGVDLLLVDCNPESIPDLAAATSRPFAAMLRTPGMFESSQSDWPELSARFDKAADCQGCVGWVATFDDGFHPEARP